MQQPLIAVDQVAFRTTTRSAENQQIQQIQQKLRRMSQRQSGWSYGEGEPVTRKSAEVAEGLAEKILKLGLDADVFPNLDGGCAAVAYHEDESVELSINAKGVVETATMERGTGPHFDVVERVRRPAHRRVAEVLKRLARGRSGEVEWRSSGFLTLNTTIAGDSAFEIWSAKTHPVHPTRPMEGEASQLSEFRVSSSVGSASAPTSRSTIGESRGLPAGFGLLTQQILSRQPRTPTRSGHPS